MGTTKIPLLRRIINAAEGDDYSFSSRFHPACPELHQILPDRHAADVQNHFIQDDNGITGPDWGRSELVFGCFLTKSFHHIGSLSGTFRSVLVSSSLCLYDLLQYKQKNTDLSSSFFPIFCFVITVQSSVSSALICCLLIF